MPVYKQAALTRYPEVKQELEGKTHKELFELFYNNADTRSWQIEHFKKYAEVALELDTLAKERFLGTYIDLNPKGEDGSRGQRILMVEGDIDDINLFRTENKKLKEDNEELRNKIKVLNLEIAREKKKAK